MADILCFSRNRCTSIEHVDDQTIRSTCRVQDNLMDAYVEIMVKLPDLELIQAKGEIRRSPQGTDLIILDDLQKVAGSRVGPGIRKIIGSIVEHVPYAESVATLLDECCNGVILSFARDVFLNAPQDKAGEKLFFANMVKANPRLYNSCAALTPDSPLMESLELDKN
ncbi:MAG TPA: hypothetical protein DEF34_08015 [Desulfotomaculum sp.]|nr:MAG: hypothetical protein VR67_05020 [Peptococcaceae bacterium BRH_c8a]KJS72850.1 MAG: hypothetical protein JL56_11880 [Desulfotomaculum sp. BICA1-6]HBX23558.1 hypothetical protein [Desulfotomaculum sp.]